MKNVEIFKLKYKSLSTQIMAKYLGELKKII